jgi:hypothetical protein
MSELAFVEVWYLNVHDLVAKALAKILDYLVARTFNFRICTIKPGLKIANYLRPILLHRLWLFEKRADWMVWNR